MAGFVNKVFIGASVVAGAMFATAPVLAAGITLSPNPISGTDYLIYKQVGNKTVEDNNPTLLPSVLQGDANAPGGNVELGASIDRGSYASLASFKNAPVTSLSGTLFGKSITLSSLTGTDWFGASMDTNYYATGTPNSTFAATWFNALLDANGFVNSIVGRAGLFQLFGALGGFQRFSDPNPSYVNQDSATSNVKIGLAGHYDATSLLLNILTANISPGYLQNLAKAAVLKQINDLRSPNKVGTPIQASEVIKVIYNGQTELKYSFVATNSGLTAADDGFSHNGNYELTVNAPEAVPEPTTMLGLLVGGGSLVAAKLKRTKKIA